MRFSVSNVPALNSFFEGASKVADEITLIAYKEYLRCQVIAKSAILIFDVQFSKDFFETYDVVEGEYMKIVSSDIFNILKSVKKEENVIFDVDDYQLHIIIDGEYRRNFTITLLDDYDDFRDLPTIDLSVRGGGELKKFQQCLKDMDLVGAPTVKFQTRGNKLLLSGKSGYKGDFQGGVCDVEGEAQAEYNKEKLTILFGFKHMGEDISFYYDNDMPLIVEYQPTNIKLVGMLAPILGDD